jgi:hypothetical protein
MFALGYVLIDAAHADDRPVAVPHRELHDQELQASPEAWLRVLSRERSARREHLAIFRDERFGKLARIYVEGGLAADGFSRLALHALERLIDQTVATIEILQVHEHRGMIHEALEARLAFTKRRFRLLAIGDVDDEPADRHDVAPGIPDRKLRLVGPVDLTLDDKVQLRGHGPTGLDHLAVHCLDLRGIFGGEDLGGSTTDHPFRRQIRQRRNRARRQQIAAVRVLQEHTDGRMLHEGVQTRPACAEVLFDLLLLGDVLHGADRTDQALRAPLILRQLAYPADASIGVTEPVFDGVLPTICFALLIGVCHP